MAGEFRRLPIKKFPKAVPRKDTVEQKYWKSFEFPTVVKEYTAINYVHFSSVPPYNCLVTSSGKIQVFAPYTHEVKKTSSRNKENIYGARYRSDGKLIVAGGETGVVQVLDVSTRSILRNLRGHTKATRVCSFGKENSTVFSASDDKTMRCWDLPVQKETLMIKAHKDYIRCGCINDANTNQFITGSYDHMIKVWDCRSSSVAVEMNHGAPVECILMHQNGSICLSAGSNYIKVWDMLAGGKLFNQFSNHLKTITTIRFDNECKRLFSGSLDRHVKIYDVEDYSMIAYIDYPSPILAMDISKDSNHLTVGMSDGAISLRHRPKATIAEKPRKRPRQFQPGTYLHRIRNQSSKPGKDDLVIPDKKPRNHTKVDKCLRRYRYHDALDAALDGSTAYIISVILELSRRDALEIALSNRDSEALNGIMMFLAKNISNPSYGKILIPVADYLIDMYTELVGQDKKFDFLLRKLRNRITMDLSAQEKMIELIGSIEQIVCMATVPPNADEICVEKFSSWEDTLSTTDVIQKTDTPDTSKGTLNLMNGVNGRTELEDIGSEVDFVVNSSEIV